MPAPRGPMKMPKPSEATKAAFAKVVPDGPGITLKPMFGQLYIEGDLRVSGTVDGALEATGDIEIAGGGKVNGAVTAYNRLVVGSDASLIGGEVRVARLTVEDGATFTGRVSMGKHKAEVVSEPAPEVQPIPEPIAEPEPVSPPQDWGLTTPKRKKGR